MGKGSPCFRITNLRLFNRPLSAYNTKIRLRRRIIKKKTQQYLVITTQEQKILKKVLRNQFRKIVYALELTKERFLIYKKHAKVLLCEFGKEN